MPQRPQNTPRPFPQLSFFRPRMTRFSTIHLGGQNKSENVENLKLKNIYIPTMLPIQTLTMGRNIVNVFKKSQSIATRAWTRISIRPEYVKSQNLNTIHLGGKTKYIRLNSFSDFYYFWKIETSYSLRRQYSCFCVLKETNSETSLL